MNARAIFALVLCVAALGCSGPDIEQICEDFVEDCGDLNDEGQCIARGELLERQAEERDCLGEWAIYLDCVDESSSLCTTEATCASERDQLERCGVTFGEE